MMNGNMMNDGMGGSFFGNFLFSIIMIIIIVLIVVIVVWMFKGENNKERKDSAYPEGDSLEVLKRRLAKGEITEEEYDRLKDKLKS
ncbi:SHOCT domain-containing protein [Aquisalibacillus elongatus]|uniref:Putative membrane protein n=1 Tax=Aquisalibacillus elongatus TaxID=485577 RepID=A0A3N5B7S3_9BACI|nr:SHOCT domain-containing protein [Aquisalibacillus elongatus]RPF53484.1 putative membrane protein [Aquisalibacillus elongatus]